jgi:hypothetical protein
VRAIDRAVFSLMLSAGPFGCARPGQIRAILIVLLSASAVAQQGQFRWASPQQDSALFAEVAGVFKRELLPDKVFNVKRVERLGIWRESVLVVIASKQADAQGWDLFEAFNFNTRTQVKAPVPKAAFERWEFETLAHFDTRDNPDIVFRHLSCDECDSAEHLLGSFRYDPVAGVWTIREWPDNNGQDLYIGGMLGESEEGSWVMDDCRHTVRDLTADGLDDVAIRCRETLDSKPNVDWTFLYTLERGKLLRRTLHGGDELTSPVQAALAKFGIRIVYSLK